MMNSIGKQKKETNDDFVTHMVIDAMTGKSRIDANTLFRLDLPW